jgi:hypothetical protein
VRAGVYWRGDERRGKAQQESAHWTKHEPHSRTG